MKSRVVTGILIAAVLLGGCGQNKMAQEAETVFEQVDDKKEKEPEIIVEPVQADEPAEIAEADGHFLAYLKGEESDADGEKFWGIGEENIDYTLYDMNDDGTNELMIRIYGTWIDDIMLYKDGKIQRAGVENVGSSGMTVINEKNQFVSADTGHEGRSVYFISELNADNEAQLVMVLENFYDDWAESGSPEFYKKENPTEQDILDQNFDAITEDEFNTLVSEYVVENKNVKWTHLETSAEGKSVSEENTEALTKDEALAAVKNYCMLMNPDLADVADNEEYPVYWDIESADDKQIVVIFRSYTGSINYYYIDPVSGETSVTELVPGIIDEEQPTDEKFNLRDYNF